MFQLTGSFRSIDFGPRHPLNPVRLVLVARAPDETARPELVLLKAFTGGRVYLAALADQTDRVIDWLEIWVQCSHDLESSPLARGALVSNATHDRQWLDAIEAARKLGGADWIETAWETHTSAPLIVDLETKAVARLVKRGTKSPLELCRDDAVLQGASLGNYSATLERWFSSRSAKGEVAWLSLEDLLARDTGEAIAVAESGAEHPTLDFNVAAGMMILRKHHPISVEGFLRWLAGADREPDSTAGGESPIEQQILDAQPQGPEVFPRGSAEAALVNALLRVQLWCALVREVHAHSSGLGAPFLNLTTESFRLVTNRPVLSRADRPIQVALVHPGDAIALKFGEQSAGFAPLRGSLDSPFSSPKFGGWVEGSGTMRVRQVGDAGDGRVRIDGVIDGSELRNVTAGNLVWIQTPVDGRSVSFFATSDIDKGSTRASAAFTAPAADLPASVANRLKSAARQPCQFVVLRPVSPVFDIYSLGVIGVRIFLAEDADSVSELVDDLFELAAVLPAGESVEDLRRLAASPELSDRLRSLLIAPRWAGSGDGALAEQVWLSILRELIEFVLAEVPSDSPSTETSAVWLEPLTERLRSLEQLAAQLGRLRSAPRSDHDEVARIIHSFV